jgi:hypothetical protein
MRSPRRRSALVAAVVGLVALTACNPPSNEPDAYDDTTRANFIQGCTGIVTEGTALDASTSSVGAGADQATCECQYDYFVNNVPFDSAAAEAAGKGADATNFVDLNQQLEDDPNSMPDDIEQGLRTACGEAGSSGEAQTGTTVGTADPSATTSTPS